MVVIDTPQNRWLEAGEYIYYILYRREETDNGVAMADIDTAWSRC